MSFSQDYDFTTSALTARLVGWKPSSCSVHASVHDSYKGLSLFGALVVQGEWVRVSTLHFPPTSTARWADTLALSPFRTFSYLFCSFSRKLFFDFSTKIWPRVLVIWSSAFDILFVIDQSMFWVSHFLKWCLSSLSWRLWIINEMDHFLWSQLSLVISLC